VPQCGTMLRSACCALWSVNVAHAPLAQNHIVVAFAHQYWRPSGTLQCGAHAALDQHRLAQHSAFSTAEVCMFRAPICTRRPIRHRSRVSVSSASVTIRKPNFSRISAMIRSASRPSLKAKESSRLVGAAAEESRSVRGHLPAMAKACSRLSMEQGPR